MSIFKKKITGKNGFSIVEVIIATSILSVVLVAAAQAAGTAVQNTTVEEHKIYAANFAQEAVDWLNVQREIDWATFRNNSTHTGANYCLNEDIGQQNLADVLDPLPCASAVIDGATIPANIPRIFDRRLSLTSVGAAAQATRVNVVVTVTWTEFGRTYTVPVRTSYTIHE